jgi:hypothetical protein
MGSTAFRRLRRTISWRTVASGSGLRDGSASDQLADFLAQRVEQDHATFAALLERFVGLAMTKRV